MSERVGRTQALVHVWVFAGTLAACACQKNYSIKNDLDSPDTLVTWNINAPSAITIRLSGSSSSSLNNKFPVPLT